MTEVIKGNARENGGKGVCRRLRAEGLVPAVIYGSGKEPQAVALVESDLIRAKGRGGFFTQIHTLEIDGKNEKVLARDVQNHPVNEKFLHVDFLRYDAKRQLKVMVALHVTGEEESPGLKKGGVLQVVRPEVELICRADSIPEFVEASMAGKDVGDSVHISEVELPEGVKPSVDRDFTVASIVSTRAANLADEAADAELAAAASEDSAEAEESTEEAKEE